MLQKSLLSQNEEQRRIAALEQQVTLQIRSTERQQVTIYFTEGGYLLQLLTCRRGKLVGN